MKLPWAKKPELIPETPNEGPTPVTETPQQALYAAQVEHEGAQYDAARLKQALLDGGDVTPEAITDAEQRAKHAALALDAARAAYERSVEQDRKDAWPVFLAAHQSNIAEDPQGDLAAALDALAPKLGKALADLQTALDVASGPATRHNESVRALAQYISIGGYVGDDQATATYRPEAPYRSSATVNGRGGSQVDVAGAVDWWLAHQLPVSKIAAWLERVEVARLNRGLPNDYLEKLHG